MLCSLILIAVLVPLVASHGFIEDPAARQVCWRTFPKCTAKHYTPDEMNCGAFSTQWDKNNGKCGVCGDPYHLKTQSSVFPGKYAKGVITGKYIEGQIITVKIRLTTNHRGWSEFRIGDIGTRPITQAKLTHFLKLTTGVTKWIHNTKKGLFTIKLQLPTGLTCRHCVLQWWWKTGNSWGCDSDGCGMGHGPQETFVNCADVSIQPRGGPLPPTNSPPLPPTPPAPTTNQPPPPPPATTSPPSPPTASPGKCRAVGAWAGNAAMDAWCVSNCAAQYCPASMCTCA